MTITAWGQMSNSRFIAADEFDGKDVTLTIKDIWTENLPDINGEPEKAGIISFEETDRQWRVNSTNRSRLAAIWPKPADAIGHKVTLMAAPETKSPSGVAIRVKGSPDLSGPTVTLDPIGLGKTRKFTLVKTANRVTAAPRPRDPEDEPQSDQPDTLLLARCAQCGNEAELTPDCTEDDVAAMVCTACDSQAMEVVS